jgi:taurine dioxygenase
MAVELRPLSPALGVELVGVDPCGDPGPEVRALARAAWLEHGLVLVRGHEVSLAEQVRFAEWFGPVNTRGSSFGGDVEMYISNSHEQGVARKGSLLLHQDHCFFEQPLPGICLYAEEVTRTGGATIFADARTAFERVPEGLRRRLSDLEALHLYDYADDDGDVRFRAATASAAAPRAVHPVVLAHPETGRPILYVNRLMTDSIVGLDDDESEALLDELMACFEGDAVRYEHTWRVHDLVVWDNLALQHGRTEFPPDERRCLRRIQIG